MDELDIKMLERLQQDGRITISQLSKELHLSRPAVNERFLRLQEQGVIEGFTAQISPEALGRIKVIIQLSDIKIPCKDVEKRLLKEESIMECHRVTGNMSYLIKASVPSTEYLEQLIDRLVPYGKVNTSLILSSPIPGRLLFKITNAQEREEDSGHSSGKSEISTKTAIQMKKM
jgi:Lrp/AsnC family transcriptional regulator, leucine-responsive regulatory protein